MKSAAKYAWTKEKKLSIWPARNPQEGMPLSGVVLIYDNGIGYCHIRFDKTVVSIVGRKMPYGIGREDLSYLKIVKMHNYYDVWCCYSNKSKSVKLWKSDHLPEWVKRIKFADN